MVLYDASGQPVSRARPFDEVAVERPRSSTLRIGRPTRARGRDINRVLDREDETASQDKFAREPLPTVARDFRRSAGPKSCRRGRNGPETILAARRWATSYIPASGHDLARASILWDASSPRASGGILLLRPTTEPAEAATEIHDPETSYIREQGPNGGPLGRAVAKMDRSAGYSPRKSPADHTCSAPSALPVVVSDSDDFSF